MNKSKSNKNKIFEILLKNNNNEIYDPCFIDISSLYIEEPILPNKLISIIKLLNEGIFIFEIEEIARQLCLIDHKNLRKVGKGGFKHLKKTIKNHNMIQKTLLREKQLKCYILFSILSQSTLENIKILIQKYILLSQICKNLRNFQTSSTITSCFMSIDLRNKKLIWNIIEKKYKDIYTNLKKDVIELDLEMLNFDTKEHLLFIPNINNLAYSINTFIEKSKRSSMESKLKFLSEYKEFHTSMVEILKNGFPYFKVNPLYDFLEYGFLGIFFSKVWNLNLKNNFSLNESMNDSQNFDVIHQKLIEKFNKTMI